jgi:hypothetical protein
LTFAFYSPIVIELENTHGDITVTHFYANSIHAATDADPDLEPTSSSDLQPVPSLTNSPGCTPGRTAAEDATSGNSSDQASRSSQASHSSQASRSAPRLVRKVRVDAWAVPASTNWTRSRMTVRKVNRGPRPAAWALPF